MGMGIFSVLAAFILRQPDKRDFIQFVNNQVIVCQVNALADLPPDIDEPYCKEQSDTEIDPYGKAIWVQGTVSDPRPFLKDEEPLGLYLSVKASSHVYLNDRLLGENGVPAVQKKDEIIGQLDSSFYVPREWLREGENKLAILMSGHYGLYPSNQVVLTVAFGPYRAAPSHGKKRYWFSIMTFGAFIIGAIYFGATARLGYEPWLSASLSLASAFAALQLVSEVSRGVWAYPYPFHDIRLVLISIFSAGVGLVIALHVLKRFYICHRLKVIIFILAIAVFGLFWVQSFDGRATWVMFVPISAAALVSILSTEAHGKTAFRYAFAMLLFAVLILINPRQFLDMYYYALLFGLFASLFIQQAVDIQAAIRNQEKTEANRSKLEAALESVSTPTPKYLLINSAGRQERRRYGDWHRRRDVSDWKSAG